MRRAAIIDIGSNSVRLVVYAGPARAPTPIFNEKLMVGLGAALATTGKIEPAAYKRGIAALARFKALTDAMQIDDLRCVATAAVRDASNGQAFLAAARDVGLIIDLLSGAEEAEAAGYGVISATPDADGIVADLGGGSLELVRVAGGKVLRGHSFPLGVLRMAALRAHEGRGFVRQIAKTLAANDWPGGDKDLPLYLVGGSWRALARFDMLLSRDALPVVAGHHMTPASAARLARRIAATDLTALAQQPGFATARVDAIPDAAALLVALVRALRSSLLIVSTSGLREGLLYQALNVSKRAEDPLLAAAAAEGRRYARFVAHGPAIDAWIAPLFADDDADAARLRLAACLMTDVASSANPDFRSERALEIALHGNWLAVDPAQRLILAQTLFTASGGNGRPFAPRLITPLLPRLKRASRWGQAIRLAQRLSGGAADALVGSGLSMDSERITLTLDRAHAALAGEQVEKRLRQLAGAMRRGWMVTTV